MIMKIIRAILTPIMLLIEFLTRPKPMNRSEEAQAKVNAAAEHYSLYQFAGCPFCIKVRQHARKLNVPLKTVDAQHDLTAKKELLEKGGSSKVPCLRIDDKGQTIWMYESKVIMQYLSDHFEKA